MAAVTSVMVVAHPVRGGDDPPRLPHALRGRLWRVPDHPRAVVKNAMGPADLAARRAGAIHCRLPRVAAARCPLAPHAFTKFRRVCFVAAQFLDLLSGISREFLFSR